MKRVFLLVALAVLLSPSVQAAQLFAMKPGSEVCTTIRFGDDGRGEYVLAIDDPGMPNEPWVDNHYTRYISSESNKITIPICFSTIGHSIGEEILLTAELDTPKGEKTFEYGICTAEYEDIDFVSSIKGSVCEAIGQHTDIMSASFSEPKKYAVPNADVTFALIVDSNFETGASISKASGDMQLTASKSTINLGNDPVSVEIRMKAPSEEGDYPFSVIVSLPGCEVDDCRREVAGVLSVSEASGQPQAGFMAWLTPENKNAEREKTVQLSFLVRNYGTGQEVTLSVAPDEGVTTNFVSYSTFIGKGDSENMPVSVRVTAKDGEQFEVRATATGKDGTSRTASSWLTVNEMKNDAQASGNNEIAEKADDDDVTLDEWDGFKSKLEGSDYNDDDFVSVTGSAPPNYTLYVAIIVIVALVAVSGFYIYRKSQSQQEGGPTWESLGV
ncbi:MAG: hypothetical protein JW789_02200 [Candidatus Aenigmarchaeota archaeon]|nr:hypothetical protein [Candidatus Aenigmarchaeota archaeon]